MDDENLSKMCHHRFFNINKDSYDRYELLFCKGIYIYIYTFIRGNLKVGCFSRFWSFARFWE